METRLYLWLEEFGDGTCRFLRNYSDLWLKTQAGNLLLISCIVHALHWTPLDQQCPGLKRKRRERPWVRYTKIYYGSITLTTTIGGEPPSLHRKYKSKGIYQINDPLKLFSLALDYRGSSPISNLPIYHYWCLLVFKTMINCYKFISKSNKIHTVKSGRDIINNTLLGVRIFNSGIIVCHKVAL